MIKDERRAFVHKLWLTPHPTAYCILLLGWVGHCHCHSLSFLPAHRTQGLVSQKESSGHCLYSLAVDVLQITCKWRRKERFSGNLPRQTKKQDQERLAIAFRPLTYAHIHISRVSLFTFTAFTFSVLTWRKMYWLPLSTCFIPTACDLSAR